MTIVGWGPGACRLYVYSVAAPPPPPPPAWDLDAAAEEEGGGGSVRRRRMGTGVCRLALAADRSCTALLRRENAGVSYNVKPLTNLLWRVADMRKEEETRAGAGEGGGLEGSDRGL